MVVYIGMHEENYSKESHFAIFAGMKQFLIAVFSRKPEKISRYIRDTFTKWARLMTSNDSTDSYIDWFQGTCAVYSVNAEGSIQEVRDMILSRVRDRDHFKLVVVEIAAIDGWLERHTWNWMSLARDTVELSNIDKPTLVQILEHGGLALELSKCYTVADVDRLLENYREYPVQDIANCRARMIAGLQERLQLLSNR